MSSIKKLIYWVLKINYYKYIYCKLNMWKGLIYTDLIFIRRCCVVSSTIAAQHSP